MCGRASIGSGTGGGEVKLVGGKLVGGKLVAGKLVAGKLVAGKFLESRYGMLAIGGEL